MVDAIIGTGSVKQAAHELGVDVCRLHNRANQIRKQIGKATVLHDGVGPTRGRR